jgi:hypothetical protein
MSERTLMLPEEQPLRGVMNYAQFADATAAPFVVLKVIEHRAYVNGAMVECLTPDSELSWGWWVVAAGGEYLLDERDLTATY